jgi:hypothetical protein
MPPDAIGARAIAFAIEQLADIDVNGIVILSPKRRNDSGSCSE